MRCGKNKIVLTVSTLVARNAPVVGFRWSLKSGGRYYFGAFRR